MQKNPDVIQLKICILFSAYLPLLSRTLQLLSPGRRRASSHERYANDIHVNTLSAAEKVPA